MAMLTKYQFLFGFLIFIGIVIQLEALSFSSASGLNLLSTSGVDITSLRAPVCSTGFVVIDGVIKCLFDNLSFFLSLMTVSSTFAFFNGVILVAFLGVMILLILELIRGTG